MQDQGSSGNVLSRGQIWNKRYVATQDRDLLAGVCASVYTSADPEEQGVLQARGRCLGSMVCEWAANVCWWYGDIRLQEQKGGGHYGRGTWGKFASRLLVPPLAEKNNGF